MELNLFYGYRDRMPKKISLEEIVQLIKGDEQLRNLTEKHRYYLSLNLKNDAQCMKESCPCFAVAARFNDGKDTANIVEMTSIGMAESDHVKKHLLPDLLRKAREDPHTLLAYTSVGNQGFHILYYYGIRNLSELENVSYSVLYGAAFDEGNRYYSDLLGIPMDPKCRKVTQLSGLAHDPEVFFNPNALPFEIEVEKPKLATKQYQASLVKKKADEDVDGGYTYTDNDKTKSVKSQILSQAGMKYGSSMTMDKNGNWVDNNKKKRDAYIDSEIRKMWQNNELSDNEALSLLKDFGID